MDAVHALKPVFHEYRTRMNRIHKVEVAVAALYYLLITPFLMFLTGWNVPVVVFLTHVLSF